jgi:pyrroline-5-carboxylate reductase
VATAVLIVGAGNMGAALTRGLHAAGGYDVTVHDVHAERMQELCAATGAQACPDWGKGARREAAIILCVKPQDLGLVAKDLAGKVRPDALVVTILAGTPMDDVQTALKHHGAVVRAMPNIAATLQNAATGMCANDACKPEHKTLAEGIFAAIGLAEWTKESLLDAVTGLSGSGPAYVYMVIEALTEGGVKMGMPRQLASRLATQTVLGAAMLVKETGLHPAILRDQVTTPGGTTISAIHELEERGLRAMLISAVETATVKSASLRKKP